MVRYPSSSSVATKRNLRPDWPLFPISGWVPGGKERKTHKMIERDLMAARDQWLDEAKTDAERFERMRSDFLCYCDHDGLFADFHGLGHLFISSLERAGVKPEMARRWPGTATSGWR